jgi:hypothetical protein
MPKLEVYEFVPALYRSSVESDVERAMIACQPLAKIDDHLILNKKRK